MGTERASRIQAMRPTVQFRDSWAERECHEHISEILLQGPVW
jgi:hypothetical protein